MARIKGERYASENMEDVLIRPAREEDVLVILKMIRELARFERLEDKVSADEERLRSTLFGARPAAEVLLAWKTGVCIGFALFFQSYSTFLAAPGLYLEDLFVQPEARGHKVGYALLLELVKLAQKRGCGRVEWAVLKWNERAIRFYEQLGAQNLEEWTGYRLEGAGLAFLASLPRPSGFTADRH